MDPAELLERRQAVGEGVGIELPACTRKCDTIGEGKELSASGLHILNGKADKVVGWGVLLPIHGEKAHALTPVDGEGEEGVVIRPTDNKVRCGGIGGIRESESGRGGLGRPLPLSSSWQRMFMLCRRFLFDTADVDALAGAFLAGVFLVLAMA
jgi:hypothetical protein